MRKNYLMAAMVAVLALILSMRDAVAQDFSALRTTAGANCTSVPGTPSCQSWIELGSCLAMAASAQGNLCTTMSSAAVQALTGAQTACGAQGVQNADMASRISELQTRVGGLQTQLRECENRPAAPAAASTRPRLPHIPVCLSAPQYGNARTQILLRNGHMCVVRMNHARRILDVIDGGDQCAQINRSEVASASCVCRPGTQPVLRQGGGYVCALIIGSERLMPSGDADPSLGARVGRLQATINELSERFDRMCAHDVATVGADGASTVTRSVECPPLGQLLMRRILEASDDASPLNTAGLEDRLQRLEANDRRQDARLDAVEARLDAVEKRWNFRFFLGGEAGLGILENMTMVVGAIGGQVRGRVAGPLSFQLSVAAMYGQYDAPLLPVTVGYMATAGIGLGFRTGNFRHEFDLGASVRSYASTGYQAVSNPTAGFLAGDYLGRLFGAEVSYLLTFHGFGIQPTVFVGYGDTVWAAITTRGNRRVFGSGNTAGLVSLFGLRASWGF